MAFKKVTNSQTDGIYILNKSDKNRYPVGFEYMAGGIIYEVKEDVTKDAGSEMRKVSSSNGDVEIMTLESIDLDLKEWDSKILNNGLKKDEEVIDVKEEKKEKVIDTVKEKKEDIKNNE